MFPKLYIMDLRLNQSLIRLEIVNVPIVGESIRPELLVRCQRQVDVAF